MKVLNLKNLRVYLIDDHPVVRSGLSRALAEEPDLEVIGQASTATQGLREAQALRPDMLLVDLELPDRDGPELIAALRQFVPDAKVVVVSGHSDEYRVAEALRAGAHGYLLKSASVEELVSGIRSAARGGSPLSPSLADGVIRAVHRAGRNAPGTIEALTSRERQVLRLFATGLSTREVAANLGISPKTVETHRIRIYEKLECRSIVDLTRIAMRSGLVQV